MAERDRKVGDATEAPASVAKNDLKVCRTNLLLDEPEINDAFSGPHERIAENIAALIRPKDSKGMSIGLEGSWGSGKSTVAKLLAKKLADHKNIALISFDAWAHEGDPLRRTFLETVIRRLQHLEGWIREEYWNNQIEILANRREEVTTKDKLTITPWGWTIGLMLALVPIGGAFITAALREDITLVPGPLAWKFLILFFVGLALTFIPFLVLFWRSRQEADILAFFFSKGPTEKTTVTNKTANPTSIEFEHTFTKVIEEALKEDHKRIVLILDNLDRVDAEDALVIWSTLQTFLQHKDTDRPPWRDRLWIIVLYDLNGISSLWRGNNGDSNEVNPSASFIDKSFQIRFEVPALILSDWRGFLMNKLNDAFPDHDETERHEVYRVMIIGQARANRMPTIRELKLYVNQIGAIHRQWAAGGQRETDAFPLSHIAYYVLLRRQGVDIIQNLMESPIQDFPPNEYRDLLGSSVRENLAAMAFNVDVALAQQLLFSDTIKNALTLASSDELSKTASLIPRGFWEMFEQIVTTEWTGGEVVKIADAAWALQQSGLLTKTPTAAMQSVQRSICRQAAAVEAWSPLAEKKAQGLATIISWKCDLLTGVNQSQRAEFIKKILEAVAAGIISQSKEASSEFKASTWLKWLNIILDAVPSETRSAGLETIVKTITTQLSQGERFQGSELPALLEVLTELTNQDESDLPVRKTLTEMADNGQISRRLHEGTDHSTNAIAWSFYFLFRYASRVDLTPILASPTSGPIAKLAASDPTIKALTDKLERFNQLPRLFTALSANNELKPFVISALRFALKSPGVTQFFNGENVVERLEFISTEVLESPEEEVELKQITSDLLKQSQVARSITARNFQRRCAWLYQIVLDTAVTDKEDFIRWCIDGLQTDSPDWNLELLSSGPLLNLALRLSDFAQVELGPAYQNALQSYANAMRSDVPVTFIRFSGNVAALLGPIDCEARSSFLDLLCSLIEESLQSLPPVVFDDFGGEFTTQLLNSNDGKRVLQLLPLLSTNDPGLNWVSEMISTNATPFLEKYDREPSVTSFKQQIRQRITDADDDSPALASLRRIANALKLTALKNGQIAFASEEIGRWRIHSTDGNGNGERLLEILEDEDADDKIQPAWSTSGLMAYVSHPPSYEIRIVDLQRGTRTDLFCDHAERTFRPSWSPDGSKLAFVTGNELEADIWMIDIASRKEKRLTGGPQRDDHPCWSPDGERIAFHRKAANETRVFVMNADGTHCRPVTFGPNDVDPSWSFNGTDILFARREPAEEAGVWVLDFQRHTETRIISDKDPHGPISSPDGKRILFQSGSESGATIYEIDAVNKVKRKLAQGSDPSWQSVIGPL